MPHGTPEYATLLAPRYQLLRELGGGTMATVWEAEDTRHGRSVAIKILRREYAATFAAARFLQEIEIAARLQHPHIVPLLDSGEAGGLLYLVMPFVEGESLRQRLQRQGSLPVGEVIRIVADVADALAYAHEKGVVHRDIKPDNILLAGRHALVTDFGVAKAVSLATAAPRDLTGGVALGTPAYMAPEQALAEPDLDARVDLYALSVVAYELLAGVPPFEGPTAQAILTAHVLDAPPPLMEKRADTPPALAALVARGLAKPRDDRWSSAEELMHALEPLATPSGGSTPASVTPVARRTSLLWPAAGLLLLAGLAIAGYLLRPAPSPRRFTERQLTFLGAVRSSAISPDGQFLAFVTDSGSGAYLMMQDIRSGRAITLARAGRMGYVAWSADGSEVRAFSYSEGATYIQIVPRLGGPGKLIRVGLWSIPSPDGSQVLDVPQGVPFLRLRNLANGDSLRVAREPGWWMSAPTWSLDGAWLAVAAFRQSGAGARLLLISATDLHQVVVLEDSVALGTPAWDGRARALYYLRGRGPLVDLYRLALKDDGHPAEPPVLVRAGVATGATDLTSAFSAPVSVTADGLGMVYTQQHEWSNLATIAFDDWKRGGSPTPLTTGSTSYSQARLAPDGQNLAVIRSQGESSMLQVLPFGSGNGQDIGQFHEATGPAWSADGQRLLIGVSDPPHGMGIRIYNRLDLTATTRFLGLVGDSPEWFDDSTVVAPQSGNRALLLYPLGAGVPRILPGLDTNGWNLWPRRSPDGARVTFARNPGGGRQVLMLFERRDSTLRAVASGPYRPVGWSRDSRTIFATLGRALADSTQVMAIPLDGGPPRLLASFPEEMQVLEVTPDGQRAIVVLQQRQADVWLMRFADRH